MSLSVGGQARPLRLFEVLTRNRQSPLGLLGRTSFAREQTFRMCTILPRQQLSSPTRLAIRRRNVIRLGRRLGRIIDEEFGTAREKKKSPYIEIRSIEIRGAERQINRVLEIAQNWNREKHTYKKQKENLSSRRLLTLLLTAILLAPNVA